VKWKLTPIAKVINGLTEAPRDWDQVKSKLVFKRKYVEGLYKLNRFEHVWVLFGFDKTSETLMRVHPRHDSSKPLVGVFASRSPTRPNKIGLTLVELVSVRDNIVTVRGLDAFDKSPVFDVKPSEEEIDY